MKLELELGVRELWVRTLRGRFDAWVVNEIGVQQATMVLNLRSGLEGFQKASHPISSPPDSSNID